MKHLLSFLEKIQNKDLFEFGSEHEIYEFENKPDRLIKVGREDVVNRWVNIFKKYPEYFPKVYKVKRSSKNPKYIFVEVQKLDTEKSIEEWGRLEDYLEYIGIVAPIIYPTIEVLFKDIIEDRSIYTECLERVKEPSMRKLFIKWCDFIKKLSDIDKEAITDIHRYNFGYDLEGTPKCLDF